LNCGDIDLKGTTKEALRERMLIKLNQAISLNETGKIYNDCSKTGCPSTAAIFITEPGKTTQRLPAAYSHLQFAPETLTEILLDNLMNQTIATARYEISQERLDKIFNGDSTKADIVDASTRARWVYVYGYCMAGQRNGYADRKMPCPDSGILSSAWEDLPESDKSIFMKRTGLNASYWAFLKGRASGTLISKDDYATKTNFKELLDAVAWAAWKTVPSADTWFKNIVKDNVPGGRMEAFAIAYFQIKKYQLVNDKTHRLSYSETKLYPLANGKPAEDQNKIDFEIAVRIARRHNGGNWWDSLNNMLAFKGNDYVKKMAGLPSYEDSGNYQALRCAAKTALEKNGLIMMPLHLG
jgi:hypothetical protein